MVCFKPCKVTFCVKVIPLLVLGSAGAVLLPPAPREGQARGAVGHGGLVPHTQQDKGGPGGVWPPRCLPQLCGASLKPQQFPTLCVLLEWVWLLSDADRQWFHKKEAESFLSSYWREAGGCLRQRRQHWWWARRGDGVSHSPSQWKELQVMILDPCVSIFYRIALSKLDSDPICEEM